MAIDWQRRRRVAGGYLEPESWHGALGGGAWATVTRCTPDMVILHLHGVSDDTLLITLSLDEAKQAAERYARAPARSEAPSASDGRDPSSLLEGLGILADMSRQLAEGALSPAAQREASLIIRATVQRLAESLTLDGRFAERKRPSWIPVSLPR